MDALYKVISAMGYTKAGLFILLLSIFIDINPGIKFNPIKSIFRYLGKAFNSSLTSELNILRGDMTNKIDKVQEEQSEQRETLNKIILYNQNKEIQSLRWEIIDFNNGILNQIKHSREQYRHVLDAYDKYNAIIDEVGFNADLEYYRNVKENGDAIRAHYEENKDGNSLYF